MRDGKKLNRILHKEINWVTRETEEISDLDKDIRSLIRILQTLIKSPPRLIRRKIYNALINQKKKVIKNEERRISLVEKRIHRFRERLDTQILKIEAQLKNEEEKENILVELTQIKEAIDINESKFLRIVSIPGGDLIKQIDKDNPDWNKVLELLKQGEQHLKGLLATLIKLQQLKQSVAKLMVAKHGKHRSAKERITAEYDLNDNSYKYQVFYKAREYYSSLIAAINQAKHQICIEVFIFDPDSIGKLIAAALIKKSKEFKIYNKQNNLSGIEQKKVILIIDGMGSLKLLNSGSKLIQEMEQAGIELHFFNCIKNTFTKYTVSSVLRHPLISLFGREHRKLCLIDNTHAYLGGMNMGEEQLPHRDTHLLLVGSPFNELMNSFQSMLEICEQYEFHALKILSKERKEKRHKIIEESKQIIEFSHSKCGYKILNNTPSIFDHGIRNEYLKFITGADKSIYITNPYFVPGKKLVRELCRAAERGVDVKIIFSKKTDHPTVDAVARIYFKKLLENGVRIFLFSNSEQDWVHAKTMSVDGLYGTIGSSNLDYVSLSLDYEINFFFGNVNLAKNLDQQFIEDLKSCEEVSLKSHKQMEKQRSIRQRIQSAIGYKMLGPMITPNMKRYE